MGWAEKRFVDQLALSREVPKLWDSIRDNIGVAIYDFNERTLKNSHYDRGDCTAMGKHCMRIHRVADGSSLEFFIAEDDRSLKTKAVNGAEAKKVCGYRLNADSSGVELFIDIKDGTEVISVEDACIRAIGDFLFKPFPKIIIGSDGSAIKL